MQELRDLAAKSGAMSVQQAILVLNARIQLRDLRIAELEARQVVAAESTVEVPEDATMTHEVATAEAHAANNGGAPEGAVELVETEEAVL